MTELTCTAPLIGAACGAQVCRKDPSQKGKYIKIILALLQSISTAVVYECAVTLVSLSQAPTAIRCVHLRHTLVTDLQRRRSFSIGRGHVCHMSQL